MSDTLSVRSISKTFYINGNALQVFYNFSVDFQLGTRTTILGKSGSGKSTLLNIIVGIEGFDGLIYSPDSFLPFGIVPQAQTLLPWRNTKDNIVLGCQLSDRVIDDNFLDRLLHELELKNYFTLYPHQLSGGMIRKVLIARALITKPRTIILDEPLTSLDFTQRMYLLDYVDKYLIDTKATLLMVTHDVEEAIALADRLIVIGGQPARVVLDVENSLRIQNPTVEPSGIRALAGFTKLANKLWVATQQNGN